MRTVDTSRRTESKAPERAARGGNARVWLNALRLAYTLPGEPAPPAWSERFSPRFLLGAALGVLAVMAWRWLQSYPTHVFDFYPLYYGGIAWLRTGNAYALGPVIPPHEQGYQLFQIGNVYPLPAVLITLPFSLLPPQVAATLWVGLLAAGLLVALRLQRWPLWYLGYLPVLEGLRIEQYTTFVVVLQMLALWALRARRPWALALCCALILTKPNQGFVFVVVVLLLAAGTRVRLWRPLLAMGVALWGGAFLLDPGWVGEWIPTLYNSHNTMHQPFFWPLALFAIPLFLVRDAIGGAVVLQFVLLPFPGSYAASALPLSVLADRRSVWLVPISLLWPFVALVVGQEWSTALTFVLPVVALSVLRRWELSRRNRWAVPPPSVDADVIEAPAA